MEDNQLVAISHATGTEKLFILLKYLYENRNKKILFLSPSYPINDQLLQEHTKELGIDVNNFNRLDTLIYRRLLKILVGHQEQIFWIKILMSKILLLKITE